MDIRKLGLAVALGSLVIFAGCEKSQPVKQDQDEQQMDDQQDQTNGNVKGNGNGNGGRCNSGYCN